MGNWLSFIIGFLIGAIITIVALAVVKGNWDKKDIVDVDPEIEEAKKQWKEQSKVY
jgi:uncharacterized membrane-anchored protein YhcB (DUF1043 family)